MSNEDPGRQESRTLPLFPLNTVVFPGAEVPLHVFEPRFLALVRGLLSESDASQRVFATTAIREGYEVGEHGARSVHRTGCVLQLTEVENVSDGSLEIVAVARQRFILDAIEASGVYPVARVRTIPDVPETVEESLCDLARATFTGYRGAVAAFSPDVYSEALPRDPVYLSWTLAALAPFPMDAQQRLLEAENASDRLHLVIGMLRNEIRTMNVIPSLPASHIARTAWSPN